MDIKENYDALYNMHLPLPPQLPYYPIDPFTPYVPQCYMEINGARRKNATRETTSTLKAWLNEHRKNPYPTKGEKIMLAICTKMTLTQVSTWFANARRRLKKENKMTWSPRNRCDDDDDFIDDEPLANSANDKCSSRSASVSSVQQQNQMLQLKQEQNQLHQNNSNQHSSSATNLDSVQHTNSILPFGLPNGLANGLSNLPNGLTNGLSNGLPNSQSALAAQHHIAAAAIASSLPPQLAAQLTPQQQQQLLLGDPNSFAAFMQQHLAALQHQQQQLHQQLNLNNNNNANNLKKIEEDSSEIVDIEDNSNLGSLSDSDSINPAASAIQQFNSLTGSNLPNLPLRTPHSNHRSTHQNNHHQNNHHNQLLSQSAASLLHQTTQNSSSQLSNLHSQLANLPQNVLINAASAAAMHAAASLNLSPMIKSTASLQAAAANHKPRIWSIVDIATNSTANLLDQASNLCNKESIKNEKKNGNSSPVHKTPSVTSSPSSGISMSSPSTTSIPTTVTNTTSSIKKEA